MGDPRIIDVQLDDRTIIWRNADVEQERRIAIYDLLEDNYFHPVGGLDRTCDGPFKLLLRVEDGRLVMDLADRDGQPLGTISLTRAPFSRTIRDYLAICDSYYQANRNATPMQIETVDMARREIGRASCRERVCQYV